MPIPVYILCSESGAEDKETRRFSHFHVIEQMNVARLSEASGQVWLVPSLEFQAVALWAREDSDGPEQEFEFRWLVRLPKGEEMVVHTGKFRFQSRLQRIVLTGGGNLFQTPGEFSVQCHIRPVGATEA